MRNRMKDTARAHIPLDNVYELDVENERRMRRDDGREAAGAIAVVGGDGESGLRALRQLGDALVPALDHLPDADLSLERLFPIPTRVEFVALLVGFLVVINVAVVVDHYGLVLLGVPLLIAVL